MSNNISCQFFYKKNCFSLKKQTLRCHLHLDFGVDVLTIDDTSISKETVRGLMLHYSDNYDQISMCFSSALSEISC